MAIPVSISNRPYSRQQAVYRDISLDFTPSPLTRDIGAITDDIAVKTSIMNIVRTRMGERKQRMAFGSRIDNSLFEIADPSSAYLLKAEIIEAIQYFEPRVYNLNVIVTPNPDAGTYIVTMYFYIRNIFSDVPVSLNFQLTRVR